MSILVNFREWFIHIFKKKILLIEKKKQIIANKFVIIPINLFYFFFIKDLLKYNKINIIYELDGLIFYDNNMKYKITINKILMNFIILDPNDINYKKEITNDINKYSKGIPFYIIVKIENINQDLNVRIDLLNYGKIEMKEYNIKDILNNKLYELLL